MMRPPLVRIVGTGEEFSRYAAEEICQHIRSAISERGVCTLALSGGETPRQAYRLMGSEPLLRSVDWERVHFFFSDERAVPPTHSQSNYGMAQHELLSHLPLAEGHVHRFKGELSPEAAAAEYELELERYFGKGNVRFDLILLGIGDDGHTAGLFPGTSAIDEEEALVRASYVARLKASRISMTFRCLNAARTIVFLVSGAKKAPILHQLFTTTHPAKNLPATFVRPVDGGLNWIIDAQAAASLGSAPAPADSHTRTRD